MKPAAACRVAALLFGGVMLSPVAAADDEPEPVLRLSRQLSTAGASETRRDLLRREYRLAQASSEFWAAYDGLNARIHGAAERLRGLRGLVEGVAAPARRAPALLEGLEATPAAMAAAPRAEDGLPAWAAAVAVLAGLTFLGFRRRAAAAKPVPPAAAMRSADVPPAALPSGPPSALAPASPPDDGGLRRDTAPLPAAAPPAPIDREREEMDHALDLAEVMLSYGRTAGAMQTLRDYLRDHPARSVRPWLKLLELFRQTGMREDFERAAESVHRHFNVRVPGWDEGISGVPLRDFFGDEDQQAIPGLEQLPHILTQIQATWPGADCLAYLRHLLVDNRGGGRMGFPVSVVNEILLLEDILNDRLAVTANDTH